MPYRTCPAWQFDSFNSMAPRKRRWQICSSYRKCTHHVKWRLGAISRRSPAMSHKAPLALACSRVGSFLEGRVSRKELSYEQERGRRTRGQVVSWLAAVAAGALRTLWLLPLRTFYKGIFYHLTKKKRKRNKEKGKEAKRKLGNWSTNPSSQTGTRFVMRHGAHSASNQEEKSERLYFCTQSSLRGLQ